MIISILGELDKKRDDTDKIEASIRDFLSNNIGEEPNQIYIGRFGDFAYFIGDCCMEFAKKFNNTFVYLVSEKITRELLGNEPYGTSADGYIQIRIDNSSYGLSGRDFWMLREADIVVTCYQSESPEANNVFDYLLKNKRNFINLGLYKVKSIKIKK